MPPEIEKLMASTPSAIAWPTAAAESDGKQPSSAADLVDRDVGARRDAVDGAAVDPERVGVRDRAAGRGGRGVGAVAVGVTGAVGVHLAADDRVVGVQERLAGDQLVLADERVAGRRQRVVAEVAGARGAVRLGRGRGQVAVVDIGGVLGPGAGVQHPHDRALAGVLGGLPELVVDGRGADERRAGVGQELLAARPSGPRPRRAASTAPRPGCRAGSARHHHRRCAAASAPSRPGRASRNAVQEALLDALHDSPGSGGPRRS